MCHFQNWAHWGLVQIVFFVLVYLYANCMEISQMLYSYTVLISEYELYGILIMEEYGITLTFACLPELVEKPKLFVVLALDTFPSRVR